MSGHQSHGKTANSNLPVSGLPFSSVAGLSDVPRQHGGKDARSLHSSPENQPPTLQSPPHQPTAHQPAAQQPPAQQPRRGSKRRQTSPSLADHEPKRRVRTKFTPSQLSILDASFAQGRYPSSAQRLHLANKLGLTDLCVQVWFQNRRARDKPSPLIPPLFLEAQALAPRTPTVAASPYEASLTQYHCSSTMPALLPPSTHPQAVTSTVANTKVENADRNPFLSSQDHGANASAKTGGVSSTVNVPRASPSIASPYTHGGNVAGRDALWTGTGNYQHPAASFVLTPGSSVLTPASSALPPAPSMPTPDSTTTKTQTTVNSSLYSHRTVASSSPIKSSPSVSRPDTLPITLPVSQAHYPITCAPQQIMSASPPQIISASPQQIIPASPQQIISASPHYVAPHPVQATLTSHQGPSMNAQAAHEPTLVQAWSQPQLIFIPTQQQVLPAASPVPASFPLHQSATGSIVFNTNASNSPAMQHVPEHTPQHVLVHPTQHPTQPSSTLALPRMQPLPANQQAALNMRSGFFVLR
ncbi:homeobox protein aristaless-like [Sycon ciliatum]|uniref:homeobox protein aristaless-like n=1 Tax=Sycon ciliatum TaxID=27933 RepID=UPI0031F6BFAD